MRTLLKRLRKYLFENLGIQVEIHPPRPQWADDRSRFTYQKKHVRFDIGAGERVLDVGNGGDPCSYATVLVDRVMAMNAARPVQPVQNRETCGLAVGLDL